MKKTKPSLLTEMQSAHLRQHVALDELTKNKTKKNPLAHVLI